jgi:hypothetical protein
MTGAGLGWLEGTVKRVDPALVVACLASAIGAESQTRAGGTRWYLESVAVGPHALAAWGPRKRPDAVETHFLVPQTVLDEMGGSAALQLARDLQVIGGRFSRADGYYDDRRRHAEPGVVADAFERGDALTHIRCGGAMRGLVPGSQELEACPPGATTYLGSPKSEARVRVYDKSAETGRDGAGIRWEIQLRREHAVAFVAGAIEAGDSLGRHVLGCIRGLVDFRDWSGRERGDRAPLLDWWAAIVADAERVGLNPPARDDSLAAKRAWLEGQVAPTLALVYYAHGAGWLNDLLRNGEERLTEAAWRLLVARFASRADDMP